MWEYIRALYQHGQVIEHYLYVMGINLLVRNKRYYQLHQFLQYHVVTDSKHVAYMLLSLEGSYPPAFQLALDMLKRIGVANDDIVDVLLTKDQVISNRIYVLVYALLIIESTSYNHLN